MIQSIQPIRRLNRPAVRVCIAALTLILCHSEDLLAQRQSGGRRAEKVKAERLSITGTLHSVTLQSAIPPNGVARVVTSEGQRWQVQLTETTDVRVNGEGGPELLRPGLFLRFYGRLTRTGKGVEPVKEMTVVTPDAAFRPTIEKEDEEAEAEPIIDDPPAGTESGDGSAPTAEGDDETATPDAATAELGAGEPDSGATASDDDKPKSRRPTTRRRERKKKPRIIPAARYWISGQLLSMKKGRLVVATGTKSVRVEVDEATRIVVEAKDLRLARANDLVKIHGSYYPDRPGFARAYDIDVTLAEPNPPTTDKPTDRSRKRGSKRSQVNTEPEKIGGEDSGEVPGDSDGKNGP